MSTPVLDRNAPFGEVTGLPGVRYYQAGNHFNGRGEYVSPEELADAMRPSRQELELEKEAKKDALKEAFKAERLAGTSVTVVEKRPAPPSAAADPLVIDENGRVDNVEFEDLHWTKLRKLVEEAGGEYLGKEQAVAYLRARG